ncbi:MAG: protein kinase [bacterium]|nr:protein kinase [bacterium]
MTELPEIPGYRVEKILGQGGMAGVYLGLQENLNRKVAIKILAPEMFQDEQYLRRFINEARTASQLSHPNIVTIHDVGQVENYCFIVMERLHESLVERVKFKPRSQLSPHEAFNIIRQIAGALDYAHGTGVIHRDIKPDNILFRKDGTPVLVDFGIARALDSQAHLTTTGMIIGTPHYMSPEQCRGEPIDGQADIYGLGIVLYEILTGNVPYQADSAAGVLLKHVQAPIPQLPPGLSKYQPLVTRMMAKEKRERVHNGDEIIRLLDSFAPDTRLETVKGIKEDAWIFNDPAGHKQKDAPTSLPEDDPGVMTLHAPLPTRHTKGRRTSRAARDSHELHPYHIHKKSRAPLVVTLIAIPFIVAAVYFLFFHTPSPPAAATEKQVEVPSEQPHGEITPPKENQTDEDYKRHLTTAEGDFRAGDYDRARQNLAKARGLKETPETKALEEKIDQGVNLLNEKNFSKYFNLARAAYKKGNIKKAKDNILQAGKFKKTPELAKLKTDAEALERKKAGQAEKARRAAARKRMLQKRDDDAYNRAKSRNTIYSYEKYLEKYPKGRHYKEAKERYDARKQAMLFEERIKDDTASETAVKRNSISAYEDYRVKYPRGRHLSEAAVKIRQLKQKLLSETKIKANLQTIRFFEAGLKAPPVGGRAYKARFSRQETRYIYTEFGYKNNLYRVADSSSPVTIVYTGSAFTQELKGTLTQDKSSRTGLYRRGMGWPEQGKWPAGSYSVTIYLDGQKAGQSRFEIY